MSDARSHYESLMLREVERWPGCSVSFERASKHRVALVSFDGRTAKNFYPSSPGDTIRGAYNAVKTLRAILLSLGASRLQRPATSNASRRKPVYRVTSLRRFYAT